MATIQHLTDDVLALVEKEEKANFEASKAQIDEETQKQEERLAQQLMHKKENIDAQANHDLERKTQGYDNRLRNELLSEKQALIRDIYAEAVQALIALDATSFANLVKGALSQLQLDEPTTLMLGEKSTQQSAELEALTKAYPNVTLAKETLRGEGGFIISQKGMDYNFTYDQLIKEQADTLAAEISKRAFQ